MSLMVGDRFLGNEECTVEYEVVAIMRADFAVAGGVVPHGTQVNWDLHFPGWDQREVAYIRQVGSDRVFILTPAQWVMDCMHGDYSDDTIFRDITDISGV